MPEVTANGIKLYYEEHGSGEPLLFIMGLGGNRLAWVPLLPRFTNTYRCIIYDHRGTGQLADPLRASAIGERPEHASGLVDGGDGSDHVRTLGHTRTEDSTAGPVRPQIRLL